jgi:hypothetical protein
VPCSSASAWRSGSRRGLRRSHCERVTAPLAGPASRYPDRARAVRLGRRAMRPGCQVRAGAGDQIAVRRVVSARQVRCHRTSPAGRVVAQGRRSVPDMRGSHRVIVLTLSAAESLCVTDGVRGRPVVSATLQTGPARPSALRSPRPGVTGRCGARRAVQRSSGHTRPAAAADDPVVSPG